MNRVGQNINPEVSGIFSFANDDRTWGVGLNGSYQKRDSGSSMSTINDWNVREADFAFRQAFAFCPRSPEAIFRYANLLVSLDRLEDALRVTLTANALDPANTQLEDLVKQLQRQQVQKK